MKITRTKPDDDEFDIGQPPGAWIDVVRRAQISRTVHSVAMTMASYADYGTGRNIHPGVARLAVDCKLTYKSVKAAIAKLRDVGLIELVEASPRRGWADNYRLIFHPDLHDRVVIRSPSEQTAEIEKVRSANRGAYKPKTDDSLRGTAYPADENAEPVDNSDLRGTGYPADDADPETSAGYGVPADLPSAGYGDANLRGTPSPPTTHAPRPNEATAQDRGDLRADLTVVGSPGLDAEPNFLPVVEMPNPERKPCTRTRCDGKTWEVGVGPGRYRKRCPQCNPQSTAEGTAA